jgi:hypothetical protein
VSKYFILVRDIQFPLEGVPDNLCEDFIKAHELKLTADKLYEDKLIFWRDRIAVRNIKNNALSKILISINNYYGCGEHDIVKLMYDFEFWIKRIEDND